ncbi:hypothetical protein Scep_003959 [Stephania cephalantha]|uniref:RIN4 pathogenic type III effector avirulence factor Avr cleavage site domain-containing protein n=1 Tax=Stephania cephalantha TaxID=152367 RepID=A0AAP0KSF4_9MAGN
MEFKREYGEKNAGWISVPQFGGWDKKPGGVTDYSMIFSRARANKKQGAIRIEIDPPNLRHEEELLAQDQEDSVMMERRKRIVSYFNCCIRP